MRVFRADETTAPRRIHAAMACVAWSAGALLLAALLWRMAPGPGTATLDERLSTVAVDTPPPLLPAPAVGDRQPRPLAGNPAPSYPPAALRDGIQGRLIARLSVDADGTVSAAHIVWHDGPPHHELDHAVLETVRGWRFEPAMRDGHAVDSVVRVPVDFSTGR